MDEEKRARRNQYRREWARRHPEKIQTYRRDHLRRAALADFLAELKIRETGQKRTKEGNTA